MNINNITIRNMYSLNVEDVPRSLRFSVSPLYSTKRTVKKSKFVWYIDRFPVGGGGSKGL